MGEQATTPETTRLMKIPSHVTAQGSQPFTSRAGLMVPATLLDRLGLAGMVDGMMPEPALSSTPSCRHSMRGRSA